MNFTQALQQTNNPELAIKLMEADAAQRKADALKSISNSLAQCVSYSGFRVTN